MNTPIIEVANLHKRFGDLIAVRDVSFSVNAGEIFGILGPNGAGKTTTVEAVTGLLPIDSGTVRVLGVDPHAEPARVRQQVGIQLQQSQLPARLRVGEALRLYASFYPDPADPEELMDLLGLTAQQHQAFEELSGGQQQRLSIALSLIGNPEIAVLDELTTGLDPLARRATWSLIEGIRDRGVTIVLVTHFMDEAERLCDRVCVIGNGEVVAIGAPAQLLAGGTQTYRVAVGGADAQQRLSLWLAGSAIPHLRQRETAVELDGTPADLSLLLSSLCSADLTLTEVTVHSRSLEDVVIDLSTTSLPRRRPIT